jgi:hypothetical protein
MRKDENLQQEYFIMALPYTQMLWQRSQLTIRARDQISQSDAADRVETSISTTGNTARRAWQYPQ